MIGSPIKLYDTSDNYAVIVAIAIVATITAGMGIENTNNTRKIPRQIVQKEKNFIIAVLKRDSDNEIRTCNSSIRHQDTKQNFTESTDALENRAAFIQLKIIFPVNNSANADNSCANKLSVAFINTAAVTNICVGKDGLVLQLSGAKSFPANDLQLKLPTFDLVNVAKRINDIRATLGLKLIAVPMWKLEQAAKNAANIPPL